MTRSMGVYTHFTCDGGCGKGRSGPIARMGKKPPGEPGYAGPYDGWKTVQNGRRRSQWRHYCPECWIRTGSYDWGMAESYRLAVENNDPIPGLVTEWFWEKCAEFFVHNDGGNRDVPLRDVVREYGLHADPVVYAMMRKEGNNPWAPEDTDSLALPHTDQKSSTPSTGGTRIRGIVTDVVRLFAGPGDKFGA